MKFRTLVRHFRESFKNIGRNGWMTFASVSAVTVTLTLVGVFLVIMMNLNHMAGNVEKDVEIRAHIDNAANDDDIKAIGKKITEMSGIETVIFSPKDEELTNLIDDLGDDGDAFKPFEQDNPLRDVYIIKTKSPQDVIKVAKKIESFEYIQSVKYGQGYVEKLFSFVNIARNIGIVLIIGLFLLRCSLFRILLKLQL